jgi:superfamily II DNA or RNA helicase
MNLEKGQIVKNLLSNEPATIDKIIPLGSKWSVTYIGVNSNKKNSKVLSQSEIDTLEVLTSEGRFNFKGDPKKFLLFTEAERINSAYQFDPLFAVNCSIVDPLPHQVEAVYKYLLPLPKIRFLLADDTGAGKTIMAGLLLKELSMRGLLDRVMIITPGGLTKQWQEDEMGIKFNFSFKLVNRAIFSAEPNVFQNSDKIVTSIDFISREDVLNVASQSHWDMIIVDEAHKLSAYDYGTKVYKSRRYEAVQELSQVCEHLLFLTATPHRGRGDTFKKLLQLLDEDIFATEDLAAKRVQEFEASGINKFFIRRLKEQMRDWNNQPLFKERYTKTTAYQLTPEEKYLYDQVTNYLLKKKEEATETRNIHVSLALTVMQRRLTSSIYAIRKTLFRRFNALNTIVEEVQKNPNLWKIRHKFEEINGESLEDYYDELVAEDEEEEGTAGLESILSDPKKFKLFTTAKDIKEIQEEAKDVKRLYDLAHDLYIRNQEEQKFRELKRLLVSEKVIDGEKLVIFTEHKDTLDYLEDRLTKHAGYKVATIHGGKNVEERRQAQFNFAQPETQILIGTDAAGEGINLQFCRLLINWDIPWNPNRLEQRMGRIHRYGQKADVLVFNLVASNTREGQVLQRLLQKLDLIRQQMGDDRVYDVIQDVLEDVSLDDVMESVFNGKSTALDQILAGSDEELKSKFEEKIKEQKERLAHSEINYADARKLKENSDEKRLQPIYIQLFFEKAFKFLGGQYEEVRSQIFRIVKLPDTIAQRLRSEYNISSDIRQLLFCFEKQIFLDYQKTGENLGKVHYINPGNPVFDALINVIRERCKEDALKGTVLISPDDNEDFFAFFVKSQITDSRTIKGEEGIADERLGLVAQGMNTHFKLTSPAKFLDLHAPNEFAKLVEAPNDIIHDDVIGWSYEHVTEPQLAETQKRVIEDTARRKEYLTTAFDQLFMDLNAEINELQGKMLITRGADNDRLNEKIARKQSRIEELKIKKRERLEQMEQMQALSQATGDFGLRLCDPAQSGRIPGALRNVPR